MTASLRKWSIPILAAMGLADSTYLSVLHWIGEIPPCGGYQGCAEVNTSVYAEIFGVPTAAFGMALSAAVLAVSLWRVRLAGRAWLNATLVLYSLVLSGALFMLYLTGVEFVVLRAVCYWCLFMAAIVFTMLVLLVTDLRAASASNPAS